eukprot:CAMPEP_0206150806 /NCGR_PEP_ID=MMETSP1473-20131121/38496_1 /ASSEMBLY_ACC=CAM_ASM_001109 /TAXON_ID=1461547 /ORGANISM="Stichococcus sp, Strain RCC1054" /LENGTH=61 /DNA_ID=CAMNT_0053548333 /DNA_START=314 /DNA_END=499 /DNA_ORIENTATION=-
MTSNTPRRQAGRHSRQPPPGRREASPPHALPPANGHSIISQIKQQLLNGNIRRLCLSALHE